MIIVAVVLSIVLFILFYLYLKNYEIVVSVGKSMSPTVNRVALAVYDPTLDWCDLSEGDIVLFYDPKLNTNILHRVVHKDSDKVVISGDNEQSATHIYTEQKDIILHGKVVYILSIF